MGGSADAEKTLGELKADDFDAVAFIGGMGAQIYLDDKKAHAIAKEFLEKGKILSAICIAPGILANAGLLKGKKAACTPGQVGNLKQHGAIYTGSGVEIDGKIITADGPKSAYKFGEEIAKQL
jgi:protease I